METGNPAEQHGGRRRSVTVAPNRFLKFTARRQPSSTAPELVTALQRARYHWPRQCDELFFANPFSLVDDYSDSLKSQSCCQMELVLTTSELK